MQQASSNEKVTSPAPPASSKFKSYCMKILRKLLPGGTGDVTLSLEHTIFDNSDPSINSGSLTDSPAWRLFITSLAPFPGVLFVILLFVMLKHLMG